MTTLATLQDRLNAIQAEIDGMKADGERGWPQKGDVHWYLSAEGRLRSDQWLGSAADEECRQIGNVFRTEAEATRERDRRVLIAELRRHPKAILPGWGSAPFHYLVRGWEKGWRWVTVYNFDCCPASGYFSEPVEGLIEQYGSHLDLLRGA